MAGIKCDWRLADLESVPDDPFAEIVLTSGLIVDLTGDEAAIHDALRKTLTIESRLFDRGVTCDLKDGGQDCMTCSSYTTDRAEARAPLCRLGRDQVTLVERASQIAASTNPYALLATSFFDYAQLAGHTYELMEA